jgi:peptidoglycan/xylan/chitin deacetylase (PgdA/CDA1 family)
MDGVKKSLKEYKDEVNKANKEIEALKKERELLLKKISIKKANPFSGDPKRYENNATQKKIAYLTFDDGPSINTEKNLDILKKEGVKATFFIDGSTSELAKRLDKRMVDEGHAIGNSTYSRNYSQIYSNVDGFFKEFDHLQSYLTELTGTKPAIFRFPGGSDNTVSRKYGGKTITMDIAKKLIEKDIPYFDWNVDSKDGAKSNSKTAIVHSVLSQSTHLHNAIILMHDSGSKTTTSEALPEIIHGLKSMGFAFETLNKDSFIVENIRPSS